MPTPPYPYDKPDAWVPRVRGTSGSWVPLPGDSRIKGARMKWKLDKAGGPGVDGGFINGQGRELAEWDIEIRTWDRDGYELLCKLVSAIAANDKAKVYDVYHPQLELLGVRRMVIEEVSPPEPEGSGGWFNARLHCVRWAPPTKKNVAAKPVPVGTIVATAPPGEGPPAKFPPPLPLPAASGAKPKP